MGPRAVRFLGVLPVVFACAGSAWAQGVEASAGSLVAHDVSQVFLRVSNRGGFGLSLSENDVGNFPRGTLNRYLFGSGLWVGGIGDVDADGQPDTITTIGYNPSELREIEWIEGAVGFSRDDARFRVLDASDPADAALFPGTPVADQELFTVFDDRFSVVTSGRPSIPLGVEVRQRSFAFTEPGLDTAIFLQWDFLNISDRIRATGYTIRDLWTGIVLDPDIQASSIGDVEDDTAAPLLIDGQEALLIWDSDFAEPGFTGPAGFLAVVPLVNPGGETTVTQLTSSGAVSGVLPVPQSDAARYTTLAAIPPRTPTIVEPGFDLRALIGWGAVELAPGGVHRTAAAFVWAAPSGTLPASLSPLDPELDQDHPLLEALVLAVRSVRDAYADRLASLPALLDFPGQPQPPGQGDDELFQNYPNPFARETTIEYRIAEAGEVELGVFDLAGREIITLASGRRDPAVYQVVWDGHSAAGVGVPAGVYVIRLTTPQSVAAIRVLKRP